MTADQRERAKIVRDFERHALTEAYTVPLLWWNRIVATSSAVKGWNITPSHFIGQDLAGVWLER
jgi:peptide/nickel transport system substrate-binding protein